MVGTPRRMLLHQHPGGWVEGTSLAYKPHDPSKGIVPSGNWPDRVKVTGRLSSEYAQHYIVFTLASARMCVRARADDAHQ
eukprot:1195203-Prorocentrum_minimum.AAC.5